MEQHIAKELSYCFPQQSCQTGLSGHDKIANILAPMLHTVMPTVEAFDHEDDSEPLFTAEFEFLPRIGEYLSIDTPPGYFRYFKVVEIWHRQDTKGGVFQACISIEEKD